MSKGVLFLMDTEIPGVSYLGNACTEKYLEEVNEMEELKDGFREKYSILVDGYEQKYNVLEHVFDHCRIADTNMYAVNADVIMQLISMLNGEQIFPEITQSEADALKREHSKIKENWGRVPTGTYYLSESRRLLGTVKASMYVEGGLFIVKAGSQCFPVLGLTPRVRDEAIIDENIIQEDVICRSPTAAATVVLGRKVNGWTVWKNVNDMPIDIYRGNPPKQEGLLNRLLGK